MIVIKRHTIIVYPVHMNINSDKIYTDDTASEAKSSFRKTNLQKESCISSRIVVSPIQQDEKIHKGLIDVVD